MSMLQEPPVAPEREDDGHATAVAIADLRSEVRRQGAGIRATERAFTIFAVLAVLLSMATLLAVALKLDRKPKTVVERVATPAAAPTAPAAPALARNVDVTLAQFAVTPSERAAAAGRVSFRVHNAGTITHEFVVIRTPRAAADLPIVRGRASEAGNVGETGDLKAGATKIVTLNLKPGHYALVCNLPGHYLAGQHSDFTVR